ncbi:hypothetical protein CJ739_2443 [Mariniflexile rhizosphaerae]|uniref:restriction endonuclease n=1 Tax=unclassified Mariniflexile TaxID=2643887 RepID=UPI000CB84E9D|nr:restriction endonuclease [Mariniflexile sp. TRM1-10]AXP81516.1 hypothetical protein CJ739_2443 [Mariniflexile sp. TRM1-10]PLB18435.1 MAG: hypothetical protein TRG1_2715 [Flavobacteriaceae bacterium FS1-H7996/R]
MKINWTEISPEDFERICFKIIEENDFKNLKWFGKSGGDKGRDLVGDKYEEPLPGVTKSNKWVIQCKRYITKPPSKADINNILIDAEEHNPTDVLIILSNTLSANTKDWIEQKRKETKYYIHIWEELDLEREINRHRRKIEELFPNFIEKNNVEFYEITDVTKHYFGCNEFENVEIRVLDSESKEEALRQVKEFIDFLKNNEIIWD